MVSDVDSDRVDSAVTALRAACVEAVGLQADVSNEADVAALVTRAVEEVGPLDVMYNNAGFDLVGGWAVPFEETSDETRQKITQVNLSGVFCGIKHAALAMKQTGGGSIVTTSSAAGIRAVPDHGHLRSGQVRRHRSGPQLCFGLAPHA